MCYKQLASQYNNNQRMFFCDYSQFLQPEPEPVGLKSPSIGFKYSESANFLCQPILNSNNQDLVYSEFTEIISKRLAALQYPTNFQNFNPFCPLCLKFVENSSIYTTCFINNERNYLIHQECFFKDKSYGLRNVGEISENAFHIQDFSQINKNKFQQALDNRSFYIEVALSHPINEKNFIKVNKKVSLMRDQFKIQLNENETDSFFPNMILVPLTDYHLTVNIAEIGNKNNRAKFTKYLSLRGVRQRKKMLIKSDQASLQIQVVENMEEKIKLTNQMNYKYKYPLDLSIPILKISCLYFSMPQQFEQESEQEYIADSRSSLVDQLLKEKTPSLSTIKTSEPSPVKQKKFSSDSNSSGDATGDAESEIVNLQKLISTNTLIDYVKNNNQSRLFQIYLSDCSPLQIQKIIAHVKSKIYDLITHQYGNYMIQKLFSLCTPYQRIEILQQIEPQLTELVCNKQGTHTIQAFMNYFTLNEEYSLIIMHIMQSYYQLCRNSNATHFIQKIIKTFALEYTLPFFQYTTENLQVFALDKNAMCVIKHMMRRLRELEGRQEAYDQAIDHIRRQLITNVTFSVDRLIVDSFGNYVIQFCYELYDLEKCSGITQRILSQFAKYSIGKFSSNVLLKCISIYWTDRRIYSYLKSLGNNQIVEIFRNKDGNKILLEIMEKLEGTQLWDRLYSVLIQVQPTRYYHDRWGVCLGSRSGQVGTHFTGFPQSRRKNYNRRY